MSEVLPDNQLALAQEAPAPAGRFEPLRAVSQLVKKPTLPAECSLCPFSKPAVMSPNRGGYYECNLLPEWAIIEPVWGETPVCTVKDWQARALVELLQAGVPLEES